MLRVKLVIFPSYAGWILKQLRITVRTGIPIHDCKLQLKLTLRSKRDRSQHSEISIKRNALVRNSEILAYE